MPVNSTAESVGRRVRTLREDRGLLQRELAGLAGMPTRTLGRLERGEVDVRLSTLVKIAQALRIEVKDLFP